MPIPPLPPRVAFALRDGAASTGDLLAAGIGDDEVRHLVSTGALLRVRRAAFVDGTRYAGASPDERYRLRVRAVLRARPGSAACHHAALAVRGLPLWGNDLRRIDLVSPAGGDNRVSGVVIYPLPDLPLETGGAWASVPVPYAALQVAIRAGRAAGVTAMDAATHSGACTLQDLAEMIPRFVRRIQLSAMLALVDPQCASVGESRTRLLLHDLGLSFRTQVRIDDDEGFIGRVDFLLEGGVVVEFDGMVKYDGAGGRAALVAEKQRESRLVAAGFEVVRLIWADLDDPEHVLHLIRRAQRRAAVRRGLR